MLDYGKKTYIMGILNVTPDSFSDGGDFTNIDIAVNHAKEMIKLGADMIDLGGESTRPGHKFVSAEEEISRIVPVIKRLKEEGLWIAAADMDGEVFYEQNLTGPIGLVIGNEGEGVSRLVKEKCDFIASVPMFGDIDSLNASVATGVLAYEIVRQRML